MSDVLERFKRLRDLAEKQKEQRARLKGSLDQIGKSLKEKGYKNLADAKKDIININAKISKKESILELKIKEFESKYEQHL